MSRQSLSQKIEKFLNTSVSTARTGIKTYKPDVLIQNYNKTLKNIQLINAISRKNTTKLEQDQDMVEISQLLKIVNEFPFSLRSKLDNDLIYLQEAKEYMKFRKQAFQKAKKEKNLFPQVKKIGTALPKRQSSEKRLITKISSYNTSRPQRISTGLQTE